MNKITSTILILCAIISHVSGQQTITPLGKNNYLKVTSYDKLSAFVHPLGEKSDLLKVETSGQTVQGRNLYALEFSSSEFGKDKSKIKVLFFAQQHGNKQSGKKALCCWHRPCSNPKTGTSLKRLILPSYRR